MLDHLLDNDQKWIDRQLEIEKTFRDMKLGSELDRQEFIGSGGTADVRDFFLTRLSGSTDSATI